MLEKSREQTPMHETVETVQPKRKNRRSEAQKMGKFAWLNYKIDRVERRQKEDHGLLQIIVNSLSLLIQVDKRDLVHLVCKDEVDEAIIDHLIGCGRNGTTPNEGISSGDLATYKLKPYQVTRRIQGMNKRLRKWLGKDVAISVHRRWRLSRFFEKSCRIE